MFAELILRRDPRLKSLISKFEMKDTVEMSFLEEINDLIGIDDCTSFFFSNFNNFF
jgi:hypothetical protein